MNRLVAFFIFAGMLHALLAAVCAFVWQREKFPRENTGVDLPPLTLLRPVKAGVPALREKLAALAAAMRAEDRLIVGVNENSPDVAIAESVRAEFAAREILVVPCAPDAARNPKISKLLAMDAAARGGHLLLSDCEMLIDGPWLEAFRREWAASGADAMTCGYRFTGASAWMQALDAAPALFSLWPGLLFVRKFSHLRFTLGACTALRRRDLEALGGWRAFADDIAEDNRLGAALAKAGRTIRLSRQVATLESDALTFRDYWRHQRRLAVTYRVCHPAGFAGMIFTHSVWLGLLAPALAPGWLALFFASQIFRGACFALVAKATGFRLARLFSTLLVSDLVETLCWFLAWLSPTVWWAGKRWRIGRDGKLRVAEGT